jgi:6-phosphogluconolactonase
MNTAARGTLHVFPDHAQLSQAAAQTFVDLAAAAIADNGRFVVALSGGSTPAALYRHLAADFHNQVDWSKVFVAWSDERFVPHDDPASNYQLAREALLNHVPIPREQTFPMPTEALSPDHAAAAYAATLDELFTGGWPRFDLLLLGMGPDGHTASLFPYSASLHETARLVVASLAPTQPQQRLTLTFPALNQAQHALVLVSGPEKAEALHTALQPDTSLDQCPAAGLDPRGQLLWYADKAAAARLSPRG